VYVVGVTAVHRANIVVLALNTVLVVTDVPPVAAVNQPSNVKPLLVGVGRLVSRPLASVSAVDGLSAFPPFTLNVMV
jgi:hypothetical protein